MPDQPRTYDITVIKPRLNDGYPFLQWQSFEEVVRYMGLDFLNLNLKAAKPSLHLTLPDRTTIAILKSAYGMNLNLKLGGINQLDFKMPFYLDINNELEREPNVDKIRNFYLIKMLIGDFTDWYIIQPTSDDFTEESDEKFVTCYHLSHQLSHYTLRNYQRVSITPFQLIEEILEPTSWYLGYISPTIRYKHRTYEVAAKKILNFLLEDVASILNCYVMFDAQNKFVHLVDPDEVGENKGLIFSYTNYLQRLGQRIEPQEFCTHLKPYGQNGLTINEVNPLGTNFIPDYSYFVYPFEKDEFGEITSHSHYMSDSLAEALVDFQAKIEAKYGEQRFAEEGTTSTNLVITGHGLTTGDYILNRTRGNTYKIVEVIDVNNLLISTIEGQVEGDEIFLYTEGTFRKLLFQKTDLRAELLTLQSQFTSLEADKARILDIVELQRDLETYFDQTINTTTSPFSHTFVFKDVEGVVEDNYVVMGKITSPSNYTITLDGAPATLAFDEWGVIGRIPKESQLDTTVAITFSGTLTGRLVVCRITQEEYDNFESDFPDEFLLDKYNVYYKEEEIDDKNTEIVAKESELSAVLVEVENLAYELSYNNEDNFTTEQLQELIESYIKEEEWTNTALAEPLDLYEEGMNAFQEINKPKTHIDVGIVNFLACLEEQHNWDKLVLGDFVRVNYQPFSVNSSNARIMELAFDFEEEDVQIILSNPARKLLTDREKSLQRLSTGITLNKVVEINKPTWDNVVQDFNTRNNRNSITPTTPYDISIFHTLNPDGTANITIEWDYPDSIAMTATDIDGFFIFVRAFEEEVEYIFGANRSREQVYNIGAARRAYTIYGTSATQHYHFGVQAYRTVDTDINSTGVLKSGIVQSNSYQPETSVSFEGSISWDNIAGKPTEFPPENHNHDTLYLNKTNTSAYTPSDNYHPATKKYVDDQILPSIVTATWQAHRVSDVMLYAEDTWEDIAWDFKDSNKCLPGIEYYDEGGGLEDSSIIVITELAGIFAYNGILRFVWDGLPGNEGLMAARLIVSYNSGSTWAEIRGSQIVFQRERGDGEIGTKCFNGSLYATDNTWIKLQVQVDDTDFKLSGWVGFDNSVAASLHLHKIN